MREGWLSFAVALLACSGEEAGGVCEPACGSGQVCVTDQCLQLCNRDSDCLATHVCKSGGCTPAVCGDGVVEALEECDRGVNNADSDLCTTECRENVCGDGHKLLGTEDCDDGNMVDNDLCTNACRDNVPCDPTIGQSCTGTGACGAGVLECGAGGLQCSSDPGGSTHISVAETCDGVDNDCDGTVDEDCPCNFTGDSRGVCGTATIGPGGTCAQPAAFEASETHCADMLDNDCDGTVNEDCPCDFMGDSDGVCANSTIQAGTGTCAQPAAWEMVEMSCGDSADNDCDGAIDEGCPCDYLGDSDGVCGTATRDASGTCAQPTNYVDHEMDCSDGFDNDCDGNIDCLTFADDFSTYMNLAEGDAAWPTSDPGDLRVDPGNDRINAFFREMDRVAMAHDLGMTVCVDRCVLRAVVHVTSHTTTTALIIGLSSTDEMGHANTNQDFIGAGFHFHVTTDRLWALDADDTTVTSFGDSDTGQTWANGTDYYYELVRSSATAGSVTVRTGSHSGPVFAQVTLVLAGTIDSLRYIKIMPEEGAAPGPVIAARIDDVEFWEGVTAP